MSRQKPIQKALVEWAWLVLRQSAVRHGKLTWREKLSDARYKVIEAALRQASPHEVARAVDGFVARSEGWTDEIRERCFNPEYILRATLLDQHIEAASTASAYYGESIGAMITEAKLEPKGLVVVVPVSQEMAEADELRALGFFGTVGDRR